MGTVIWQGDAINIAQISTVTLGGVWLANDTITLTISDKDLTLTIGATVDIPTILDNLVVMVSGTGTFDTDYSANALGDSTGEFSELTATEDGATILTLTANTAGTPFTLTSARVTASTGTVADATPTANGSSNDWNNVDNWDTGVVPVAADDIIFQDNASDVLHGLDQSAAGTMASIRFDASYTGGVGNPRTNAQGSISYAEYRETFLKLNSTLVDVGRGEGTGSSRIKYDGLAVASTVTVEGTGSGEFADIPAFLYRGTNAGNLYVLLDGSIGLGFFGADLADGGTITALEATVELKNGTITTVNMDGGGEFTTRGNHTTHIQRGSGTSNLEGAGGLTTLTIESGLVNDNSSANSVNLSLFSGATLDLTNNPSGSKTYSGASIEFHIGSSVVDLRGISIFTNGFKIPGGTLTDVSLNLGKDRVYTPS